MREPQVLSPSTASTDRAVKVPIYAREKVAHVWLVDPLLQTLEVLRLDGPGYRIAGVSRGDVVVQCEPSAKVPRLAGAGAVPIPSQRVAFSRHVTHGSARSLVLVVAVCVLALGEPEPRSTPLGSAFPHFAAA